MRSLALAALLLAPPLAAGAPRHLDGFDTASTWTASGSDGVEARVSAGDGCRGTGLRLDYDFRGGSGYAVARRPLALVFPGNWAVSFCLRAEGAANDVELKFVDPSGDNVWWWRRKAFSPSSGFERVTVRKRNVAFAWGPAGGGELKEAAALEIALVAGAGGKGALFLDELSFEELPPEAPPGAATRVGVLVGKGV